MKKKILFLTCLSVFTFVQINADESPVSPSLWKFDWDYLKQWASGISSLLPASWEESSATQKAVIGASAAVAAVTCVGGICYLTRKAAWENDLSTALNNIEQYTITLFHTTENNDKKNINGVLKITEKITEKSKTYALTHANAVKAKTTINNKYKEKETHSNITNQSIKQESNKALYIAFNALFNNPLAKLQMIAQLKDTVPSLATTPPDSTSEPAGTLNILELEKRGWFTSNSCTSSTIQSADYTKSDLESLEKLQTIWAQLNPQQRIIEKFIPDDRKSTSEIREKK